MATDTQLREQRIEIRIRPQDKKFLEKAASTFGLSLSAFILSNSLKAAKEGLSAPDRITLSEQEWNHFMKVMEKPPRPNKALRAAARRHGFV
jgi:uncharacterized protein (DUF1778 family)